ncbi:MAG TPA: DegT/DnrJ/EryC1/StrS family aminotransferase, partial [Gemmatimonadaceae bacterium]|nr:DegT/DnrJ/EryC1/StrS family aminotransferase [Gemmatimonadaceae bacterium]
VMAEFALVGARRSKLGAMAETGDRRARRALQAVADLDRYISGTQLGITLASLALGWIGEPALAVVVDRILARFGIDVPPGMAHTAAGTITAFLIITFLHIVLGELAPKSVALVMPERISGWVALPLMAFSRVMSPFIWLLNGTANALLRLAGIRPMSEAHHAHTPEELRLLVMQARGAGTLNETDSAMLAGIFDFAAKRVHDVMRPRTEIVALPIDATEDEVTAVVKRERYSRYPVYDDSLDDIVGVFLSKDLWLRDDSRPFRLREHLRDPLLVPGSRSAERVLDDLRRTRAQMAVVLDEFGGTAGIVTMEDLIEEVVDVTLPTYNIDVSQLEAALSPKTKAVMLAHALGNPFNLDAVTAFCQKHGLWLVEDCCDALGATYRGRPVGSFGDIATLSFYPAHHITMGEGGAVFTNDPQLKLIAESFRDWGRDCYCPPGKDNTCGKRFEWQLGSLPAGYDHKYIYSHNGYNLKISDMQAACALAQMDRLDDFVQARKANFA